MNRRLAIPILLAAAVGLGYAAFTAPSSNGTIAIDIAFLLTVLGFLVLMVTEFGEQLKRLTADTQGCAVQGQTQSVDAQPSRRSSRQQSSS